MQAPSKKNAPRQNETQRLAIEILKLARTAAFRIQRHGRADHAIPFEKNRSTAALRS